MTWPEYGTEDTETTLSADRYAHLKRVEAALIRVCNGEMTHEELARWRRNYRVALSLVLTVLLMVSPVFAGEFHANWSAPPPAPASHQMWEPGGHFSLAAASAFGTSIVCERAWVGIDRYTSLFDASGAWADRHIWLVRLACGCLAMAGVAAVATFEHHHDVGFNHDDAVADWAGAFAGAAAAGATGLFTIRF
jgi:hypothetical protein